MRLLVDNALSPIVAERLRDGGHDAVHLRDLADPSLPDTAVFDLAAETERSASSSRPTPTSAPSSPSAPHAARRSS